MSTVFNGFGCTGGNRSPHLAWSGEPSGTISFALILHDPDALTGTGWYHWVAFNIPPTVHELKEGAGEKGSPDLPAGAVLGLTDFGFSEYGGPCPPVGDKPYHYNFTIYALSSKVDGGPTITGAALRFIARGSTLAIGRITGFVRTLTGQNEHPLREDNGNFPERPFSSGLSLMDWKHGYAKSAAPHADE